MCGDQLLTLKRAIEQKKTNNLNYSQSKATASMPPVTMKQAYAFMANENNEILNMIEIMEKSG